MIFDWSRAQVQRLRRAWGYSMQGFSAAWTREAAFQLELVLLIVALPLSVCLAKGPVQWLALFGSILFIIIVELLNSALEALCDAVSTEHHPLIGIAKDMGSAAVTVACTGAGLVWATVAYMNLWPN